MARMKSILTTGQVAEICCVAPRTVQKWFDGGLLEGYIIPGGKDRRVPVDEMITFMEKHKMPVPEVLRELSRSKLA